MHLGQPGQIGTIVKSVKGRDTVNDRLNELERIVKQLTVARSGDYTTIGTGGLFNVDGTENISGDLNVSGNAEFGGHMAIVGTLSLPAGIIDNAALAHPFAANFIYSEDNSIGAVPTFVTTPSLIHSATLPMPSGFNSGSVIVTVDVGCSNPTGATQFLYVAAGVNGAVATPIAQAILAGFAGSASSTVVFPFGVPPLSPGDPITVEAHGGATVGGLNGCNAHISAQYVFYNV